MPEIRKVEIRNFRSLKAFCWYPAAGINCLIGSGDSGKSSILDAVDFCLGVRRNIPITDADFFLLDVDTPIEITITLGALDESLKNIDAYGLYLGGFDPATGEVGLEPEADQETVLTVRLTIEGDLEPRWSLVSERAVAQDQSKNLNWADRVCLAPTRLGAVSDYNLGWGRGSILNKVSEERADASTALATAAREARNAFGDSAKDQFDQTLKVVANTAKFLGVPVGEKVKALLDAHSVSFSGGTISLHDENGIPLRGLGLGSTRLLIAGLQRYAADQASIVLVDELEYGLEPHRIIRLLDALGAKKQNPPIQALMTTHSPVAVRELHGDQLFVVRRMDDHHEVWQVGTADEVQGTIRKYPDALLAPSIIVCEGASEVGMLRGLDQFRVDQELPSITACGVALVDGGGGTTFNRARAFQSLGYRVAVLRDSDVHPTPVETSFTGDGGVVFSWRDGHALEDELFFSLSRVATDMLLAQAIELKGENLINEHIKSATQNSMDLKSIRTESLTNGISQESRAFLGTAARCRKPTQSWFKSVSAMEAVAYDIIGPDLENLEAGFRAVIDQIFGWTDAGR